MECEPVSNSSLENVVSPLPTIPGPYAPIPILVSDPEDEAPMLASAGTRPADQNVMYKSCLELDTID
jgi:hypothetical protein